MHAFIDSVWEFDFDEFEVAFEHRMPLAHSLDTANCKLGFVLEFGVFKLIFCERASECLLGWLVGWLCAVCA